MRPNALCRVLLALTAVSGGIASAQPGPPPQPPPPPMDTTNPDNPAPPEPPAPPTPPPPPPAPVQQAPAEEPDRPEGVSLALGAGYGLPTSLETPNRTSARLRLASGLTFEPMVTISNTSTTMEDAAGMEAEDKHTTFGLATLIRLPLVSRGKVDLEGLGTAGFQSDKDNPDQDYNTTTINTFGIGYGIGIGYWISRHWNFSMSVTNPLVSYEQTKRQIGPGMSIKSGDTTIGIIFVPSVFMMIHLYN
jgi:hypothetical protein